MRLIISKLNDPRQYVLDYPKTNGIIAQAIQLEHGQVSQAQLDNMLSAILKQGNDALVNVALNLAPSYTIVKLILESLERVINLDISAEIFAIPVILVAGSTKRLSLPSHLSNEQLNQVILANTSFGQNDIYLSGKLFDPSVISKIQPSQIYYWAKNINQASLFLPIKLSVSTIETVNESVFLRFLIGVNCNLSSSIYSLSNNTFSPLAMQIMRLINKTLAKPGLTLFPIPLAPVSLTRALNVGHMYRKEIAISVAISNIAKQIRGQGFDPKATITTSHSTIEIFINSETSQLNETSLWHLSQFEDFEQIITLLTNLLNEMQIPWIMI